MAIGVTPSYKDVAQFAQQHTLRLAILVVTGMTAAAPNTIPHGLPVAPIAVFYGAQTTGTAAGFESAAADGTNLTYTTGTAQTTITAYCLY